MKFVPRDFIQISIVSISWKRIENIFIDPGFLLTMIFSSIFLSLFQELYCYRWYVEISTSVKGQF